MPLQNGVKIAAEQRRHQIIQLKMAGVSEAVIAQQLGVSQALVWKDIKRRLAEVRRDDKEAVEAEYNLQRSRYERLLLKWWNLAIGADTEEAARATGLVLDILRRLDTIGGLVPEKPLIVFNQNNLGDAPTAISIMVTTPDNQQMPFVDYVLSKRPLELIDGDGHDGHISSSD